MWGREVMVTRGGSYTHEAAGHAAMVSTETGIKSKEVGIISLGLYAKIFLFGKIFSPLFK